MPGFIHMQATKQEDRAPRTRAESVFHHCCVTVPRHAVNACLPELLLLGQWCKHRCCQRLNERISDRASDAVPLGVLAAEALTQEFREGIPSRKPRLLTASATDYLPSFRPRTNLSKGKRNIRRDSPQLENHGMSLLWSKTGWNGVASFRVCTKREP